jgi:hypothetical protein
MPNFNGYCGLWFDRVSSVASPIKVLALDLSGLHTTSSAGAATNEEKCFFRETSFTLPYRRKLVKLIYAWLETENQVVY